MKLFAIRRLKCPIISIKLSSTSFLINGVSMERNCGSLVFFSSIVHTNVQTKLSVKIIARDKYCQNLSLEFQGT